MSDNEQTSSTERPSTRKPYGFACRGCKKRKAKCDGRMPGCERCERLKEPCVYEMKPRTTVTVKQTVATIRRHQAFLKGLSDDPDLPISYKNRITSYLEEAEWYPDLYSNVTFTSEAESSPRNNANVTSGLPITTRRHQVDGTTEQKDSWLAESNHVQTSSVFEHEPSVQDSNQREDLDEMLLHLSMDESGKISHFGSTSMLYQQPPAHVVNRHFAVDERSSGSDPTTSYQTAPGTQRHGYEPSQQVQPWGLESSVRSDQTSLGMGITELESWKNLAYNRLRLDFADEAETILQLLEGYFSWQYAVHCVIYKPAFFRDMALDGSNFNQFLLCTLCAVAANNLRSPAVPSTSHVGGLSVIGRDVLNAANSGFESGTRTPAGSDTGIEYLAKAKLLLQAEMDKPSSIPTIQGLLLLGQRECAYGNLSQGWMYTGMAFRAMRDLGIHLDCNRLPKFGFGTLSAEDREIRRRLFWSAYTWDKVISLALGRAPTFNAFQNASPGDIVDSSEDDALWKPYYGADSDADTMAVYPPRKSYVALTFRAWTRLSEIIQGITLRIFTGRPKAAQQLEFVRDKHEALLRWFQNLPIAIKMEVANLPDVCPPPHIFTLNAMYRTAWILLYKLYTPYGLTAQMAPLEVCRQATEICNTMATELHQLFKLYGATFRLKHMTYTLSYAMYAAATIHAMNFRSTDLGVSGPAAEMLPFSLHVLDKCRVHTPGVRRSIDIIKKHFLRSDNALQDSSRKRMAQETALPVTKRRHFAEPLEQYARHGLLEVSPGTGQVELSTDPGSTLLTDANSLNDLYLQAILDNWHTEAIPSPQHAWDMDTLAGMANASMGFDWSAWNSQ